MSSINLHDLVLSSAFLRNEDNVKTLIGYCSKPNGRLLKNVTVRLNPGPVRGYCNVIACITPSSSSCNYKFIKTPLPNNQEDNNSARRTELLFKSEFLTCLGFCIM